MPPNYLLYFRAILFEVLLLQWNSSTGGQGALGWAFLLGYAACALGLYFWDKAGRLPASFIPWTFSLDIAISSLLLYLAPDLSTDFYVTYFMVILASCFLQKSHLSFLLAAVCCVAYGGLTFPGLELALQPAYLLKLTLLVIMAFFSTIMVDNQKRIRDRLEARVEWMQRLSLIGRGLTSILHEVKTPLNTIVLNVEYARELERQGKKPGDAIDLIGSEAERACAILSSLMEYSKPAELTLMPLRLDAAVMKVLESMKIRLIDKEISLDSDLGEPARILGSERHVIQAFTNVVMNAIEAMPLGGRLTLRSHRERGRIRIDVSDTGVGITKERLDTIFEPFETSRGTTGGVGLGLGIVRWIMEKHGGEIAIASPKPGRGAVVSLTFPALSPKS